MLTTETGAPSVPPRPAGTFVTFEGVDGVGKTTQCALLCRALEESGREVVRLREPGGTALGENIRALLLDPACDRMDPVCELLLYEAARAQLVGEVVRPALARGCVVVSDRFFDSTLAYQGFGRDLDTQLVDRANDLGCAGCRPDRTLVLDMSPERAFERATRSGADRMEREGVDFQRRVRDGFAYAARREPQRIRVLSADGGVQQVWNRVRSALLDLFELPEHAPSIEVDRG